MKKIVFLVLILSTLFAFGKDDGRREYNSYGFFTGLNYNMYSSDFSTLPGVPCCSPLFDNANGVGLSIGLLADFQTNNILEYSGFDFRLSYDMLDAEYNVGEIAGNTIKDELIDMNNPSKTPVDDVNINHNLLIGFDKASYNSIIEYYYDCEQRLNLENFLITEDYLEIIEECSLPNVIKSMTPIIDLKYNYKDIEQYLLFDFLSSK
jgi:hypothetical protein